MRGIGTETVEEIMSTHSNKRVRNRQRYMSNSGSKFVIVDRDPHSPQLWQRWPDLSARLFGQSRGSVGCPQLWRNTAIVTPTKTVEEVTAAQAAILKTLHFL